ncbi:hypothetical protein GCM10027615_35530 [Plantactinospora veratri]
MQRLGMARLDWLVVRDLNMIESATWWKDGPEIASGELVTEEIGTEVFVLPAAAHTEKDGSFTNTNRLLQWRHQAVEPAGDRRSDLWFVYHLGRIIRQKLAGSTDPKDRPILDLTWDYPTIGRTGEPDAEAVLAEINGWDADGRPLSTYTELADDGSTACGCWIYCGVYKDGINQAARRKPAEEQSWVSPEWAWAWPANRRMLYNRASARPDGRPWSERKKYVWWDADAGRWTGYDIPDFEPSKPPDYQPPEGARGWPRCAAPTRSSCRPTGSAGSSRRPASSTGRCRPTTSRRTPLWTIRSTASSATRPGCSGRTSRTSTTRTARSAARRSSRTW